MKISVVVLEWKMQETIVPFFEKLYLKFSSNGQTDRSKRVYAFSKHMTTRHYLMLSIKSLAVCALDKILKFQ